MSGWAQRDAEMKEDEASELEELRAEVEKLRAERVSAADAWDEAVRLYAVWKDGEQYVGVMRRPLAEVLRTNPYRKEADDGK